MDHLLGFFPWYNNNPRPINVLGKNEKMKRLKRQRFFFEIHYIPVNHQ
jgi:hypothetical protein